MKKIIIRLIFVAAILGILARIIYVNIFYPQTKLYYVTENDFMFNDVKTDIMDVRITSHPEGILAEIECNLLNCSDEVRQIEKRNIGVVNGGKYLYCDISDGTEVKLNPGEEIKTIIVFKIEEEEWNQFKDSDLVFLDFNESIVKRDVFKGEE